MITRLATLEDLPVLLEFEQGLIEEERPMDPTIKEGKISYYSLHDLIVRSDSDIFVVENEGLILGSGSVQIRKDRPYLKHDAMAYLGFMYVRKDHRGQGVNRMVLDALIEWCKKRKLTELKLTVYNSNDPAIRAYEKAGFENYYTMMRLSVDTD